MFSHGGFAVDYFGNFCGDNLLCGSSLVKFSVNCRNKTANEFAIFNAVSHMIVVYSG